MDCEDFFLPAFSENLTWVYWWHFKANSRRFCVVVMIHAASIARTKWKDFNACRLNDPGECLTSVFYSLRCAVFVRSEGKKKTFFKVDRSLFSFDKQKIMFSRFLLLGFSHSTSRGNLRTTQTSRSTTSRIVKSDKRLEKRLSVPNLVFWRSCLNTNRNVSGNGRPRSMPSHLTQSIGHYIYVTSRTSNGISEFSFNRLDLIWWRAEGSWWHVARCSE